jgi:polysaccharide biosynthesis transport protein
VARVSQQKEAEIKASLAAQKERVLKLKSEQDEMAVLVRELDSAQRIYDNALLRFGQTSMESQSGQTDIAVLNSATPPLKSSSPKIILNIMVSIFLGAILATVAAMFAEVIDRKVRCAEDLSTNLNVPLLADLTNKKTFSFSDWLKSKSVLKQNKNKKTLISKYQFSTK